MTQFINRSNCKHECEKIVFGWKLPITTNTILINNKYCLDQKIGRLGFIFLLAILSLTSLIKKRKVES